MPENKPSILDVQPSNKPSIPNPAAAAAAPLAQESQASEQQLPSALLLNLYRETQELFMAAQAVESQIPAHEKSGILYTQVLPLLQMIAEKTSQIAAATSSSAKLAENLYRDLEEGVYDDGDDENEGEFGEDGDDEAEDRGDEIADEDDDYVISARLYNNLYAYLLTYGFVVPSGKAADPALADPAKTAREIIMQLLYEAEEDTYQQAIAGLIQGFPTVPLAQEIQEIQQRFLAAQQGQAQPQKP